LGELVPWPRNPRQIRQDQARRLSESLDEFGQVDVIAIGPGGEVYNGHQRLNVWAEEHGPDMEVVVRVASRALTEKEREKLVVLLHRGATGEWDFDVLANEFELGELLEWGFEERDLDLGLWHTEPPEDPGPQIDRAEELQEKWQVQRGQVWQVGRHRLICGDSRDIAPVAASVLVYDPEWDDPVPISRQYESVLAFGDGATIGRTLDMFGVPAWVFSWDCVSSWYTPNRPLRRQKMCAWFGDLGSYQFDGWHYGDAGEQRQVWNTRGEYLYIPDPRGKHLSDVYVEPITRFHADNSHPHSKPTDWITLLLANCTRGDIYDPFVGSGTTYVAAERLGRLVQGVEIEPKYCAVTLERLTGIGMEARILTGTNES
jgi:hypothetical protein